MFSGHCFGFVVAIFDLAQDVEAIQARPTLAANCKFPGITHISENFSRCVSS